MGAGHFSRAAGLPHRPLHGKRHRGTRARDTMLGGGPRHRLTTLGADMRPHLLKAQGERVLAGDLLGQEAGKQGQEEQQPFLQFHGKPRQSSELKKASAITAKINSSLLRNTEKEEKGRHLGATEEAFKMMSGRLRVLRRDWAEGFSRRRLDLGPPQPTHSSCPVGVPPAAPGTARCPQADPAPRTEDRAKEGSTGDSPLGNLQAENHRPPM